MFNFEPLRMASKPERMRSAHCVAEWGSPSSPDAGMSEFAEMARCGSEVDVDSSTCVAVAMFTMRSNGGPRDHRGAGFIEGLELTENSGSHGIVTHYPCESLGGFGAVSSFLYSHKSEGRLSYPISLQQRDIRYI